MVVGASFYVTRSRGEPRLVAVGMLRNHTGNTELNPLADMATGSIVQHLAQNGQVDVVDLRRLPGAESARGDTQQSPRTLSEKLAREAGAGKLVTGDIYSKGDSLLVQMQIVSSADGHVIQQLDPVVTPAANAYLLLDRLRDGVTGAVTALADTLYLPWSTAHSRPPKYAAFQEFMQGLDAIVHTGVKPAVEHLRKAVTLDTGFVEAKIWLLEQVSMMPDQREYVDSISRAALAQRAGLGAFDQVSLDRELAFLSGRWEEAYDASRRLVQIAPTTPDARVYLAQSAMATRRYAEALSVMHGIDRSKGWLKDLPQLWQWDLQAHRLYGDAQGGLTEWRQLRARLPEDYPACAAGLPLLAMTGREADVDALLRECSSMHGAPRTIDRPLEIVGRVYRRAGFSDASRRAFERALSIRSPLAAADPRRARGVADLDCELGNWNKAYEILRQSPDSGDADYQTTLGVVAAHVGDTSVVNKSLRWIEGWGRRSRATGEDKMDRAFVVLASGDRQGALRLLRQSMVEGVAPPWNAWYIRYELAPLRGDPQFEEMLAPRS
jgi:tetratricopeptide (TPR) repeat protein/TolB-like protein